MPILAKKCITRNTFQVQNSMLFFFLLLICPIKMFTFSNEYYDLCVHLLVLTSSFSLHKHVVHANLISLQIGIKISLPGIHSWKSFENIIITKLVLCRRKNGLQMFITLCKITFLF